MKNHLMNFLNKYNLLYLLQSGFRLNHSCQTALTFMIDRWLKAVDKGELIGAAFLDFAKAFDLLDHELHLHKLQKYRFSYTSLQWFSSYLNDRRQIVSISNTFSDLQQVKSGSFKPVLFLIFINDIYLYRTQIITLIFLLMIVLYRRLGKTSFV